MIKWDVNVLWSQEDLSIAIRNGSNTLTRVKLSGQRNKGRKRWSWVLRPEHSIPCSAVHEDRWKFHLELPSNQSKKGNKLT